MTYILNNSCKIASRWLPQNNSDDKSTLNQVWLGAIWQQAITWNNVLKFYDVIWSHLAPNKLAGMLQ